jgi:hypothetical protein
LLDAVVEPPIDSEQYSANGSGEDNEKERHGHDLVDVGQTDCSHQDVAETTLGCEHLAKQGSNQTIGTGSDDVWVNPMPPLPPRADVTASSSHAGEVPALAMKIGRCAILHPLTATSRKLSASLATGPNNRPIRSHSTPNCRLQRTKSVS